MRGILEQKYYKHRTKASVSDRVINASVEEIISLAEKHLNKKVSQLKVLDVGCGSGEYAFRLGVRVKKVVGVEPFEPVYQKAIKEKRRRGKSALNVVFFNKKIEDFDSKQKFDVVVSITTIEHMPDAKKSFKRIFKLMSKGAILYLTAPNKTWPLEAHYHLPFLSWLPVKWANEYMKLSGKGDSYEDCSYSLTYDGTKRFFDQFPCKYYFLVPADAQVGYLGCGEGGGIYRFVLKLGIWLIKMSPRFWNISKGFIVVAIKK